jgi:hypothetical protein
MEIEKMITVNEITAGTEAEIAAAQAIVAKYHGDPWGLDAAMTNWTGAASQAPAAMADRFATWLSQWPTIRTNAATWLKAEHIERQATEYVTFGRVTPLLKSIGFVA